MRVLKIIALIISSLTFSYSMAAPSLSSSSHSSPYNAIKISDPCPAAWNQVKSRFKNKLAIGGVQLDLKKAFMLKCGEYRDKLIAEIKKPINTAQAQLNQAKDKLTTEARSTFMSWVAEKVKNQILPSLPAEIQAKYDPNSPLVQAKAQQWLNDHQDEISTYINEYIKAKAPTIANMLETYNELTAGESATIIKSLKGVLNKAQARLNAIIAAKREIEQNPDIPYTKILQKYGISGEWLKHFMYYEGKINAFTQATNAKVIVMTTIEAFQTDDPKEKIAKLFIIIDAASAAASDSKIPIVALVGDIVNAMAKVGKKTLEEVRSLGELLNKRAGYCVGTGAPGDDKRSVILDKRGVLACPLSLKTKPWKNIYKSVEPQSGLLYFWTGSKFIDGEASGGGRAGIIASMRLIADAKSLGYKASANNLSDIANVYNTPGGIPKLMQQANRVVSDIARQAKRINSAMGTEGKCTKEQIINHIESNTGLKVKTFLKELEQHGEQRLVTTYAASYVAKTGGFGFSGDKRANAYDTYTKLWNELKNLQIIIIDGKVKKRSSPNTNCKECAQALINTKVNQGKEVRGCEIWQTDSNGNFSMHIVTKTPPVNIKLSATTSVGKSDERQLSINSGNQAITLFINDSPQDKNCETAQNHLNNAEAMLKANELTQALSYLDNARKADCDKLKPEIERISDEIERARSSKDEFDRAINSCDENELHSQLSNEKLNQSQKQSIQQRLKALKTAQFIMNKKISTEAQLTQAISEHQQILNAIKNCPITDKIARSLQRLQQLQQSLATAKQALSSCSIASIEQAINTLIPFNQPVTETLLEKLQQSQNSLKAARTMYNNARVDYKQGQLESSRDKLVQAKSQLTKLNCPTDKIDKVIAAVNDAINATNNPSIALASCKLSVINLTLNKIKGDAKHQKLIKQLQRIKQGILLFNQAHALYRQGKLTQAATNLKQADKLFGNYCSQYKQRIKTGLSQIAHLQRLRAAIEQAISNCDRDYLLKAQARLNQKVNPYLNVLLPKIKTALQTCKAESSQKPPSTRDGDPICRDQYGVGAYASAINPDGSYFCTCKAGYIWQQKAPRGCVKAPRVSGNAQCKKEFGKAAYAIKRNANGTFQCQCRRGYRFNSSNTRCIRVTVRSGHPVCRKQFGRGAYAIRVNRNGSYQCQCRDGYTWNSRRTYCRTLTARDGHRACKRYFGRTSYATSYAGRGRWNCYTPPRRPAIPRGRRCPAGQYWDSSEGCVGGRMRNPLSCPPGYHRPPSGGPCHRN